MIELKEYQKEASEMVEDKFNLGLNKTCIIWPTGLGKTIVPIDLMKKHPNKKFLVIAPRHSILKQIRGYMEEEKISSEDVIFYTYSGLSKMSEELMSKLEPDYIILDEMHRAGAKEWGKGIDRLFEMYLEANSLGLTATPTRMDGKNIVEEKFNGDIAHQITLEEAIARGLLKMPKAYINAVYSLDREIEDIEKSIEKIQDEKERKELTKKLEEVKRRLKESKGLDEIFAERMSNKSGKYIIFCKDITHMHEMMEKAEEWFKGINETIETYSISSEKNPLQNSRELKHFEKNDNKSLKLLYSVEMFNEGLHIKNDGIIMLRPTASWIIYLQQLGRTLGIQESGEVFDIVNNSRSSKDIYQFYETVKNIQQKEKIEGVKIDFTIYDEVRDIEELLEEINESIHIDYFSTEEKIEYFRGLKEQGEDLSEIKTSDKGKDGKPIGVWVVQLRTAYKKGKLSEDEIKQIEELGIDLEGQRLSNKEKIEYLKKLKEEDKEIDLSEIKAIDKAKDGMPIGDWVIKWRKAYKKGKLSKEEIKQITELGIDLEAQKKQTSIAEKIEYFRGLKEQGEDLSEIKARDKAKDGKPIGEWRWELRRVYKKGKLSEEEIKQITELGIDLEVQRKLTSNAEKIEYFRGLKEQGEDLSEIKERDKEKGVMPKGDWVIQWRKAYKKGKLSKEEIKQITELGIDLEGQRLSNKEKIEYFRGLKEQGEDLSEIKTSDKGKDEKPIGVWVVQLRTAYKKGKLSKDEIKQITELGIELSLRDKQEEKASAEEKLGEAKNLYEQYEELIGEKKELE